MKQAPLKENTDSLDFRKPSTYTLDTADDNKTSIEIYFTDGKGVYYHTQPELEILDHSTGKQVMKFERTVNAAGNPEPKKIAPGTYDLRLSGHTKFFVSNVQVVDKKKNKVIITVAKGGLRFAYEGNAGRPVTEFTATVTRKFEMPILTTKQKCNEEAYYPPGSYYSEINTVPITRFTADIDFGSETEVRIPEPGYVVFVHASLIVKVALYQPLRDKNDQYVFRHFGNFDLSADSNKQKIQLKPGSYQAQYYTPDAKEKVIRFSVKSNEVTEVELL